jgi:GxxExxY protein
MEIELKRLGLQAERQAAIKVHYRNQVVGKYFADLLVEDAVIVELKTVKSLGKEHEAQLLNYLKSTIYEVGLLLNFGPKTKILRKVLDNERKGNLSWTKKDSTKK